jgi:large subunit ribosomal protein LX
MRFRVSGRYQARDGHQPFDKTVDAPNADVAVEHVYALLGSEHGLTRMQIELDDPEEVAS